MPVSEFRVNSFAEGDQSGPSRVVGLTGGDFVIAWQSEAQDGSGLGIFAQRYDENGFSLGNEFQVNSSTAGSQGGADFIGLELGSLADGGFAVVWSSPRQDGNGNDIFAQRFNEVGQPQGTEFRVNPFPTGVHGDFGKAAVVTGLTTGEFLISWSSHGQDGDGLGVLAQRFDANGMAIGSEFQVNTYVTSHQYQPSISALGSGGFVIAWRSSWQDGSFGGTFAQRYDADGSAVGSEFQVSTSTLWSQNRPSVTELANGDFVVVWHDGSGDGDGLRIAGQRFSSSGVGLGSEFQINTTTAFEQGFPSVAGLADDGFIVSWTTQVANGASLGVFAQRFDSDGTAVGNELRVNEVSPSTGVALNLAMPDVAALANGGFVITWDSDSIDKNGIGIAAQRFDASGVPLPAPLTSDPASDDLLFGDDGDNYLKGGGGDDYLDGGAGDDLLAPGPGTDTVFGGGSPGRVGRDGDRVDYRFGFQGPNGVLVNLSSVERTFNSIVVAAGTAVDPDGSVDSISGIESAGGSDFDDWLIGNDESNSLLGGLGSDWLEGLGSADWFDPGPGEDVVIGGSGINDHLEYGQQGGAQYPSSGAALVNLSSASLILAGVEVAAENAIDPFGEVDRLVQVEDVGGTRFDDWFVGNHEPNVLLARLGDDYVDGGAGDDWLAPGPGNDTVNGGTEVDGDYVDYSSGGFGQDLWQTGADPSGALVNLSSTDKYVNGINLAANTALDPDGGVDSLSEIEHVNGTAFDDILIGNDDYNKLYGGDGNDMLQGLDGNDHLEGGPGDDTLDAGPGDDTLDGGDGDDFIDGGDGGAILVNLSYEPQTLNGIEVDAYTALDSSGGVDALTGIENASGTPFDDWLVGSDDRNILVGGSGNDYLDGGAGDDWLDPGPGDDTVAGGTSIWGDRIDYGTGFDSSNGVLVNLSSTDKTVNGIDLAADTALDPDGGVDSLSEIEQINGTAFDDILIGNDEDNKLYGGDGNDTLQGLDGSDYLEGGPGDDSIDAGPGDDHISGGAGDDHIDGGDGIDFVAFSGATLDDYLIESDSDGILTVTDLNLEDGDDGTDTLVNVELLGLEVVGTDGDDVLFLDGTESILAVGKDGDDLYILKNVEDYVIEETDEGTDTIQADISRRLEPNVENLTLTGEADIDGVGNELDNELNGNIGNNILNGREGADRMAGGTGADTYYVDNVDDQVIETGAQILTLQLFTSSDLLSRNGGAGDIHQEDIADDIDEVVATISYTLTDFVENLTLSGVVDIDGTGNALDNVILGNSGDNVLATGSGADDRLIGNAGDDAFIVNKMNGKTLVKDLPGGGDKLDLFEFTDGKLTVGSSGDALVIENATGGLVAVYGFFANGDTPISTIDLGAGEIDITGAANTADVAQALNATDLGELVSVVDDDRNLFDSSLLTSDGTAVSTAEAQLFRTYSGVMGRDPDDAGYDWWLNQIAIGNHDLRSMAEGFIFSDEFLAFFAASDGNSIDNAAFVDHMYVNVFGREPDQGGFDFWYTELDSGTRTQVDVLVEMTQSNEFVQLTVFATVDYLVG